MQERKSEREIDRLENNEVSMCQIVNGKERKKGREMARENEREGQKGRKREKGREWIMHQIRKVCLLYGQSICRKTIKHENTLPHPINMKTHTGPEPKM